jgi:hypothetical protein
MSPPINLVTSTSAVQTGEHKRLADDHLPASRNQQQMFTSDGFTHDPLRQGRQTGEEFNTSRFQGSQQLMGQGIQEPSSHFS